MKKRKTLSFYSYLKLFFIFTFTFYSYSSAQGDFNQRIFQLKNAKLLIPLDFKVDSNKAIFIIHLHGKSEVVQKLYLESRLPFPLITIHLGMFSGPYRNAFSDTNFLLSTLNEAIDIIKKENQLKINSTKLNLIFTSFSAGYGGIREILKCKSYYDLTSAIILLDGLHTDYVLTNEGRFVNPDQMKDFLRFARDAVKFKKQLIITHSEIIPDGYSSTTETAQYLIDSTFTEKVFAERKWDDEFIQKYYAFNGNFSVYGFYGNTAKDHIQHLYNLPQFLKLINFK
ncbi:MAG: hypothetical protein ACPL25_11610 [Ignavibacteria bacterium]